MRSQPCNCNLTYWKYSCNWLVRLLILSSAANLKIWSSLNELWNLTAFAFTSTKPIASLQAKVNYPLWSTHWYEVFCLKFNSKVIASAHFELLPHFYTSFTTSVNPQLASTILSYVRLFNTKAHLWRQLPFRQLQLAIHQHQWSWFLALACLRNWSWPFQRSQPHRNHLQLLRKQRAYHSTRK